MSMDIHQILKQLPHRYPILLVDRVLEIEKGKSIKALKNVTINEPFFTGHFPHHPVMPGVLILEALAQAAALLAFDTLGAAPDDKTVYYFAGIDGARFKRPVEPGDQLTLEVELDRMKAGIFKFKARAKVGDVVATEADLMCTMRSIRQPGQYSGVFPIDDNASWEKNAATLRQLHRLRDRIKSLESAFESQKK